MRLGEVSDMDVVTNAGAVRSGVVGPEDRDGGSCQCRPDGERNQVSFVGMVFSHSPSGSAPAALKYLSEIKSALPALLNA